MALDMNDFARKVQLIIRQVFVARDWRLVSPQNEDAFIRDVLATARAWADDSGVSLHENQIMKQLIERAAVSEYSRLLWRSLGENETPQQERTLIEVLDYITPIISRYTPDIGTAQSIANDVLFSVWQNHTTVRAPSTFLSWVAMIASRTTHRWIHNEQYREVTFSDIFLDNADQDDASDTLSHYSAATLLHDFREAAANEESTIQLEKCIQRCLKTMKTGADVFIALVLHDESVAEVASRLKLSHTNVYSTRHRAIARLQKCPELRALLQESCLSTGMITKPGGSTETKNSK